MFKFFSSPNTSQTTLYPLAWISIVFSIGILLANSLLLTKEYFLIPAIICAILAAIFIKQRPASIFIFFAFCLLGAFCFQAERNSIAPDRLRNLYDSDTFASNDPIEIKGTVTTKPELAVGGYFIKLDAESAVYKGADQKVSGIVRLFAVMPNEQIAAEYEGLDLQYGSKITAACRLEREERFLNLGVVSHKQILDQQGIDATCTVKSPLLIEKTGQENTFALLALAHEYRQNLILEFRRLFSVSSAGVLIASLLGNRYHLDKATSEHFREGGTFHVLVISGLHITFLGGILLLMFRRYIKNRLFQFLLTNSLLWIFAFTVGGEAPVMRAALVFTVLHFSSVIFRQATLLNSLGASALFLLLLRPSSIFDPSFQLTFVCVLAILTMGFPLLEKLKAIGAWHPTIDTPRPPNVSPWLKQFAECLYWSEKQWEKELKLSVWEYSLFKTPLAAKLEEKGLQKILRHLFETITVSAIVQLWLIPFLIIYFHRVSLISILLNVWVGAAVAIQSVLALLAVLFGQIHEIAAAPFVWLTEILNWLILHIADPFVENGWASLRIPIYSGPMKTVYALYFVPILVLVFLLYRWNPFALVNKKQEVASLKLVLSARAALFLIVIYHPFSAPKPDGRLHVEFLDVGQGDTIFVTFPNGETMLIDGGGRPGLKRPITDGEETEYFEPDIQEIGDSVVSEFLWEKGYDRVDYLVATHADIDHIQGLSRVAENFKIGAAFAGRAPEKDENFLSFKAVLDKKGIPLEMLSQDDAIEIDGAKLDILSPEENNPGASAGNNNDSIVMRLAFGDKKILLTGDIEEGAERQLLQTPGYLQADIVKVAHHGSKTSSTQEFIKASRSQIAIISVGKNSPFNHPDDNVVGRWKAAGVKVLTTGENGTISFSTDGKDMQIHTFSGKEIYR